MDLILQWEGSHAKYSKSAMFDLGLSGSFEFVTYGLRNGHVGPVECEGTDARGK